MARVSTRRAAPRTRHSLRNRTAIIFAVAVAVTALALALSAYLITRSAQENEAIEKSLSQSRFNLFLADSVLPREPRSSDYTDLLNALQIRGDFSTLIETPTETYLSGPHVERGLIGDELAALVAQGRLGFQSVLLGDERAIAVGGQVRPELTMYFFYPQGDRLADLARLGTTLLFGGIILAVLGALVGYLLARRLVSPIRSTIAAAERMSWGDLDIRLREGRDEFGALARSFNRMAENLQSKMDDLEAGQIRERRFVSDVAHELRTPVAALVGEASLLRSRLETAPDACPPDVRRLADLVTTDIGRLRQLVDDLLETGRLDAKAADIVVEWVDMTEFIRSLVAAHGWGEAVRPSPGTAGVGAEAGLSEEPGAGLVVYTDKHRVERIITNLVENALRHGRPPVTIDLERWEAEDGGTVVQIVVTDGGSGIPPAHLDHIFDRFYKVDPSRSSSPGSGLGLAIARENARLLGGDLVAANAKTGGARFVLTLPAGY